MTWPEYIIVKRYVAPEPATMDQVAEAIIRSLAMGGIDYPFSPTIENIILERIWYWPIVLPGGKVAVAELPSPFVAGYHCAICKTTYFDELENLQKHRCQNEL